ELTEAAAPALAAVRAELEAGRPAALATLLDGDQAGAKLAVTADGVVGSLGVTDLLDHSVAREARGFLDEGVSRVRRYGAGGEVMGDDLAVYIQAFASRPRMIIFGAIDFSVAVARLAREVGYAVTICDAREAFASSPRFSDVAEVVIDWPDRYMEGRSL